MSVAPVVLFLVFIVGTLFDSGHETQVILLPDHDGSVGRVEVATAGGKTLLTEAGQMTRVTAPDKLSSVPVTLSDEVIQASYPALFAAEPLPPVKFLLYFEQGSSRLLPASEAQLSKIIDVIELRQSYAVGVYGHSDRTGAYDYNLQLSLQRALVVRDLLSRQGVRSALMDVASHGEGNPLVPTADGVAEPRNRRVEVVIR